MSFVNHYKPPPPKVLSTAPPAEPYDINFAHPLPLDTLQTHKVKLTPFLPHVHAEPFFAATVAGSADHSNAPSANVWHYLPWNFQTVEDMLTLVEEFRSIPEFIMFAVLDRAKLDAGIHERDCIAGIIGLVGASHVSRVVEMGPVIVLPAYHGKHIAKHAIGLLLRYVLEAESGLPAGATPGLGLRRVQWTAHSANPASMRCAESMGFVREAFLRWTWVLDESKEGRPLKSEGRGGHMGRDSVHLALCWDDWEGGVREKVFKILESE